MNNSVSGFAVRRLQAIHKPQLDYKRLKPKDKAKTASGPARYAWLFIPLTSKLYSYTLLLIRRKLAIVAGRIISHSFNIWLNLPIINSSPVIACFNFRQRITAQYTDRRVLVRTQIASCQGITQQIEANNRFCSSGIPLPSFRHQAGRKRER